MTPSDIIWQMIKETKRHGMGVRELAILLKYPEREVMKWHRKRKCSLVHLCKWADALGVELIIERPQRRTATPRRKPGRHPGKVEL